LKVLEPLTFHLLPLTMFLGIDLGTGSVKALLLDADGCVISEASSSYPVHAPHPTWAETHTEEWWQATVKAVREAASGREVKAIGLSGQMHGTVLVDKHCNVLRPAILWADTRSSQQLGRYRALSNEQRQRLANPIATGMTGVSLLWLKDNEPDIYKQTRWVLQPKDWIRLKLTSEVNAEPSDASATLLYDLEKGAWAHDIVERLELRTDFLAPLVKSRDIAGTLTREAANELGLSENIPIAAGAGDAAASALGSALLSEGQLQVNIGTAMQIFAIREKAKVDPTIRTHLYRSSLDNYYAMAAMQNAGIALEWVRRILGMTWDDMYTEAFKVSPAQISSTSNGVTFLPYLTGERTPHLDPTIRGMWYGLDLSHERGHLARAAFEGVAFALKDGLIALENTGIHADSLRLAGGGTLHPSWRQLLADVLEKPLEAVSVPSSSARGAALLAGLAVNAFALQDITAFTPKPERVAEPVSDEGLETAYQRFRGLYVNNRTQEIKP
jgi:xylulokinase